jgi:pyruvate dehydrogenase E1 component alpha subunit
MAKPGKAADAAKGGKLPPAKELLQYYRDMLLIRRFEEKAGQLYGMGLIGGFCHLYIGQEAVVVGLHGLRQEGRRQSSPPIATTAHMLATGMDSKGVMAELTGRAAAAIPRARAARCTCSPREALLRRPRHRRRAGAARHGPGLRQRYRGNDNVSLTYFGDGAANQGQVYESFNMAALWKLPVIYVIENNRYAMGTSVDRASAQPAFYKRGESVRHPGRAGRRHGVVRR